MEGEKRKGLRSPSKVRLVAGMLIEGQKEIGHLAKAKVHEALGKISEEHARNEQPAANVPVRSRCP